MPNVPKWVADQMEQLLSSKYLNAQVTDTITYSPEIKKITFRATLDHIDFHPGASMVIRASDRELRHYTPSAFDRNTGLFDILFHIHGNGPGSHLADRLLPGDQLKMSIPGGKKLYDKEKPIHFFFGDETSLSFYGALKKDICSRRQSAMGIFELNEVNRKVPRSLGYHVATVPKSADQPGSPALSLLEGWIEATPEIIHQQAVFYLTGNVRSVQRVRIALKSHGINVRNIKVQGYWAEGSVGL